MNLIETNDLCKRYGQKLVIDHVNMHVPEKAIYGFVGENGSGKTTIMRLITGLAEPSGGTFKLFGIQNTERAIHKSRKNISAIVETASLAPTLTAKQNMIYQELYEGIKLTDEERNELLKKVHLDEVGNKKVKNFSLGMRQRLAIALALMDQPKLMILDEPMNGLDPEGIAELRDLIIELNKKEGITVLISSHILSELEKIATHYGFINKGKLIEEITTEQLQKRCRKSIKVKVNDISSGEKVIQKLGIKDYAVSPNGDIEIYDEISINKLVPSLNKGGVEILGISTSEESVEDYYLHLVRGA